MTATASSEATFETPPDAPAHVHAQEKPLATWPTLKKLLARFRPELPRTAFTFGLVLFRTALELSVPFVVKVIVDDLTHARALGTAREGDHVPALMLLAALLAVRVVIAYAVSVGSADLAQDIENRLRSDLFAQVLRLRFRWHDRNRSGKTIARALRDMERARHFFREVAFGYLEMILVFLLTLVACFAVHWTFGLAVAVFSCTGVALTLRAGGRIARMDLHADDAYDHVTTVIQENVAGARVIRAFGREPEEVQKFGGRLGTVTERWQALGRFWTGVMPWIGSFHPFGFTTAIVIGAYGVHRGWATVGDTAAVVLYVRTLHVRLRNLNRLVISGQQAVASAARVFEVLENRDVDPSAAAPRALPERERNAARQGERAHRENVGDLRIEEVTFSYTPGTPVLRGLSLHVPAGGSLGILGPTGAGKTTLVGLLPRFYDVDAGRIALDGIDIRELDVAELRRSVGIVAQEPFLFSATVADNIAYGSPGVTRERVVECARQAAAHEFVEKLPKGYDTLVGERGVSLSGGQRQRLTIARALAMDPRVLVFDDATAAVDALTEKELFDGIRAAARGRTTLVISQRIPSLRWCDRVAVIELGRVIALGTHDELIGTCALYAEIHEHQKLQKEGRQDA